MHKFATAVAERLGGFQRVAGERFGERATALGERVLDPHEQALERRRHVAQFRPGALLHGFEAGVEQRGRLVVALAELLVDRPATVDEGILDLRELGAEIGGEQGGPVADLDDKFAAAPVDRALEARQRVAERRLDPARVRGKREIDRIAVSGGRGLELLGPRSRICRQPIRIVAEALVEVVAARVHHRVDGVEMSGDACVELVGMGAQAIDDVMPAFADKAVQRLEILAHVLGLLRHRVHKAHATIIDDAVEGRDLVTQRIVHVARPGRRGGRHVIGQRGEAFVDMRSLVGHPGQRLRR